MPPPNAERPPWELGQHWEATWRHALKVMKAQGTWAWEQKPLLDEYVYALREAHRARQIAEKDSYHVTDKGLIHPHPGFAIADRSARRAAVLAELLVLTPKAQEALAEPPPPEPPKAGAVAVGLDDQSGL